MLPKACRRLLAAFALSRLVVGVVYGSVVWFVYGHSDDYIHIELMTETSFRQWDTGYAHQGRLLGGLLVFGAFGHVDVVAELGSVRAFSLLFLALLGGVGFTVARGLGMPKAIAVAFAGALLLNPGAAIYAGWASTFPYPLGAALGCLAAGLIGSRSRQLWAAAASGVLLVLALNFYQPAALVYFALVALHHLFRDSAERRYSWLALAVGGAAQVAYFLLYKGMMAWLPFTNISHLAERAGFTDDPFGKLQLFLTDYTPQAALGPAALFSSESRYLLLLVPLAIAWAHLARAVRDKSLGSAGVNTAFLAAAYVATASPYLLPMESNATFRLAYPSIVLLQSLFLAGGWKLAQGRRRPESFVLAGIAAYLVAAAALSFFQVNWRLALPLAREYAVHQTALQKHFEAPPHTLFYLHPLTPPEERKIEFRHDFLRSTVWLPWVPGPMLRLASRELWPDAGEHHLNVIQLYPWQTRQPPADVPLLDGHEIMFGQPSPPPEMYPGPLMTGFIPPRRTHPLLGELERLNGNWVFWPNVGYTY
ncbi:MAG: glucosyltransferase domain-containing protein, partial [Verrucomicrobiota bacterium]